MHVLDFYTIDELYSMLKDFERELNSLKEIIELHNAIKERSGLVSKSFESRVKLLVSSIDILKEELGLSGEEGV
jgi:hypothetical protein